MGPITLGQEWERELRALPEGWDSYDAQRPTISAIQTINGISVVPLNDGGIQLEIHRDGFDVEIEIAPDGSVIGAVVARRT